MLKYRGIEITKEIIRNFATGGGKPNLIARYHATVVEAPQVEMVTRTGTPPPQQHLVGGASEEELCDRIDEVLGPPQEE